MWLCGRRADRRRVRQRDRPHDQRHRSLPAGRDRTDCCTRQHGRCTCAASYRSGCRAAVPGSEPEVMGPAMERTLPRATIAASASGRTNGPAGKALP